MTSYRRNFIPGGSFFFSVNLADRSLSLLTAHIDLLRAAFREIRQRHPFTIDAIVVLPEHLHTVWTMPDGDANFAMRWRQIKSAFSRNLENSETVSPSRAAKGERGIWQRRYWEHASPAGVRKWHPHATCHSSRRRSTWAHRSEDLGRGSLLQRV